MPVQNHAFEKTPAEQHHEPVAIQGRAFAWGGDVVKSGHAVAEPAPDGLRAVAQQQEEFANPQIADVLELLREPGIDMVAVDVKRLPFAGRSFCRTPAIAAKPRQHELHHITLTMVRWRCVGEDEQLHFVWLTQQPRPHRTGHELGGVLLNEVACPRNRD